MRAGVTFLLSFLASTWAYNITQPNAQDVWSTQGPEIVAWTTVDTDQTTFNMVLVNDLSSLQITLLTGVNGGLHSIQVPAPVQAYPPGQAFRVNFLSPNGGILAQSSRFNITEGTSTVSAVSASGTTGTPTGTSATSGSSGSSDSSGSTGTPGTTSLTPTTSTSSAASSYAVQIGLLAFSLLGFAFA